MSITTATGEVTYSSSHQMKGKHFIVDFKNQSIILFPILTLLQNFARFVFAMAPSVTLRKKVAVSDLRTMASSVMCHQIRHRSSRPLWWHYDLSLFDKGSRNGRFRGLDRQQGPTNRYPEGLIGKFQNVIVEKKLKHDSENEHFYLSHRYFAYTQHSSLGIWIRMNDNLNEPRFHLHVLFYDSLQTST